MASIQKTLALLIYLLLQFAFMTTAQVLLTEIFSSKQSTDPKVWFANILILLLFPELMMLVYDVWMSNIIALKRYKEWPETRTLINGVVISIIDAMALGFLSTVVFPKLPPFLLAGIFCVGISPAARPFNENKKVTSCCCNGRRSILPIAQLLLTMSISASLILGNVMTIGNAIFFGLSLIIINLARFTPLQISIAGANTKEAQNAGILYRFVRIVILTLTVWIAFMHSNDNQKTFPFADITIDITVVNVGILCICVLLVQTESYIPMLSTRTAMLSSITCFCTTLTVFIFVLYVHLGNDLGLFRNIASFPVSFSVCHIILYSSTCVSVLLYYFSIFDDIQEGHDSFKECFSASYDNVFICQNLVRKILSKSTRSEKSKSILSRVFVCTTMYQESATEMRRLLRSLKNISVSKVTKKRNIYFESHIFLDNGASGKEVKNFGIQLLTLIEEIFKMEEQYGIMIYTPYGIKFSWNVPGEMPLFLHLKDSSLVKAKKRWSQVMYMKYILQYRGKVQRLFHKTTNHANSVYNEPLDLFDVRIDVQPNSLQTENDTNNANDGNIPIVTFDTSSKTSSFSDLTTVTQLEENGSKSKEAQKSPSDNDEYDVSSDQKQEVTLRVPRLHLTTKNRRSSFDHSFISLQNLPVTQYSFDPELQKEELPYDFSRPKFRSSSFSDIEFEYHKYKRNELQQRKTEIQENENYQDFILATDADMAFDDQSVLNLLNTIEKDKTIGGVCGRTFPIGIHRHPVVWLQMFDYAKDFWMIKSAQNIIGSVMCCPGCFSLYRFEAIDDVIDTFSMPTESMSDVFTKDNGEDRWMCTLMMKAGWSLRYSYHGNNTTFCPEETEEFMKQRRRWLLSDFANAAVVAWNLIPMMKNNTAFTLVYTLYLLQLFVVTILYPGSTVLMLALGFELVTDCPLLVNAAFLSSICLVYCIVQISSWNTYKKLIVSKLLIIVMGLLTTYVFVATSVFLIQMLIKDIGLGFVTSHIANLVLLGVVFLYLYSLLLHPFDIHLILAGIVYLFYLPLLNILLPLYAVCNIVDQTWGTRDDQKASVPRILRLPKFKKRKKSMSLKHRSNSYESLSSSAIDLQEVSEDETLFWQSLVTDSIGAGVNTGLTPEQRTKGLRSLRNRALAGYLTVNMLWVAVLTGFYAFLTKFFTDKLVYGVIVLSLLGISAIIQILGMTVYRCSDMLIRFGRLIS